LRQVRSAAAADAESRKALVQESRMESESNNHALNVLKALRARADRKGKVQIDMNELCRVTGLEEIVMRECLSDLENERFIRTEIICYIADEWR
jgi:hypothetical protein